MYAEKMKIDCNEIMERSFRLIKKTNNVKIYRLCDSIVKEFEYLNQRMEDKILFKIGYLDRMWRPEPYPKIPLKDLLQKNCFSNQQSKYLDHCLKR